MDHSAPILSCPAKGPAKTFKKNLEETSHEKLHTKSFNDCSYFIRIGWIVLWPQHPGKGYFSSQLEPYSANATRRHSADVRAPLGSVLNIA